MLVGTAHRAPLGTGTVVGEHHHERVVHHAEALERREDASDLGIGVGQEAREDLLLPAEQAPLVPRELAPRLHPFGPRGEHGPFGDDPRGDLAFEHFLAPRVPPLVEDAAVGVDPFGRDVVRCVHGSQREVQEERLARRGLLLVQHHADRLVGQVLAEVVALFGPAGRVDVVVVADQIGGPVVGVALEEAVVALETEAERPRVEGPGRRALPSGGQVPLPDGQRRVAGVAQQAGSAAAVGGRRAW